MKSEVDRIRPEVDIQEQVVEWASSLSGAEVGWPEVVSFLDVLDLVDARAQRETAIQAASRATTRLNTIRATSDLRVSELRVASIGNRVNERQASVAGYDHYYSVWHRSAADLVAAHRRLVHGPSEALVATVRSMEWIRDQILNPVPH